MPSNIYDNITQSVISHLEKGTRPWLCPWRTTRPLRVTGAPYRGINVLILWDTAQAKGYKNPTWMTFRQAKELGGHIKKGERSSEVIYAAKSGEGELNLETGELSESNKLIYRTYRVFNCDQIEGLPNAFDVEHTTEHEIDNKSEVFFANTEADIRHGGEKAFYLPSQDFIQMPEMELFFERDRYYSVLSHECIHWTKHETRLDRDMSRKKWGDEGYAMEELVAELGAAYLCTDLGLEADVRDDHAPYIASWLKVLNNDNRAVFTASSKAEQAVTYLHKLQEN